MPTAQDTFRSMIRDEIAPALRTLGFRGSGAVYELPDEHFWRLVGFQKSRSSDRSEVRFTVNLTRADRMRWLAALESNPWLGPKPSGNADYGLPDVVEVTRLGQLMPGRQDVWWTVGASATTGDVSRRVVSALEVYGVPWLGGRSSDIGGH